MNNDSIMLSGSYKLSLSIVNICNVLTDNKRYALADQLLRSGTSIGANLREAQYAQSTADFICKLSISLKEANETQYWLELIADTESNLSDACKEAHGQCSQLKYMLISAVKKSKRK